jgi:WXG100 family type VII secretion target
MHVWPLRIYAFSITQYECVLCSRSKSSIEGELGRMMSSANEVMSTWSGTSRQQFESQWEQWCQKLRTMMEELQSLSNGLRREAEEFEAVDRSFLAA